MTLSGTSDVAHNLGRLMLAAVWRKKRACQQGEPADSLLSPEENLTASAVAALITDMRVWVHRRVENAEVIDDVAIIRRSSIDFTVPEQLNGVATRDALSAFGEGFVPITFLKKKPLRNFDLRDANGCPLPMLSRRDNGALATNVLVSQAEAVLQRALPPEMRGPLHDVAEGPGPTARQALMDWSRYAADSRHPHQREWVLLARRDGFMELANALVDDFIVCAVTDKVPTKRTIIKLSYEEPFGNESQHFLAWRWKLLDFDVRQSRLADSYHFELAAPADMEAGGALLYFDPLGATNDPTPPDVIDVPEGQRVHLYTSSVPSSVDAHTFVALRARREGNLRAAVLTGLLSATLLWAGYLELDDIAGRDQSQISAALLLLGPTLLAAALVRPGEHQLVTRVFFWVRVLTVGCMLSLLTAVGLLAGAVEEQRDCIWLGCAIAASCCLLGLLAAYRLPRAP